MVADCCQRLLKTTASIQRAQVKFESTMCALVDRLDSRLTSVEGAVTQLTEAFSSRPLKSPAGVKRSSPSAPLVATMGAKKVQKGPVTTVSVPKAFALRTPSPMLRPATPIDVADLRETGAIGYMEERLKGRPDAPNEKTRGDGVYHSFKSVLMPGEEETLSPQRYAEARVEVTNLLEILEDRLIARLRRLFIKYGITMGANSGLATWSKLAYNTLDGKFSQLQGTKKNPGPYPNVRAHFLLGVPPIEIEEYEARPEKYARGFKKANK